ncbi:MAG: TetR/AcrR family transcriptional regulator [Acidobacteriota bacterium]
MARPREHDERAAREGAVEAFLRTGYAATSLTMLEQATGLDRRQLYNQHASKRGVFLQALGDFTDRAAARFLGKLEAPSADLQAIRDTLHDMVDVADTEAGRLGCLVCNTAREPIAQQDAAIGEVVERYFARIERAYANALRGAGRSKQIDPATDRRRTARHLLAIHVALCVMSRAGASAETLRDVADGALASLR